ncbi:hypothetical protein LCGC14_1021350 [marine sediment metagenome]|uniref:ABC transmembrane type-1 domain-containing protein n=1 Tax=marine sediment metagenome TaxID=412755 RepID=A0A0F9MXF2_9ZZZZ|nr:ABC transporter permease [bacterium]
MSLVKYIIRRLIVMIPVLFGVLTLTFILTRLMPGDPVGSLIQARGIMKPTPEYYRMVKRQLGLDDPIIIQYFRYIGELFTGQWGVSVSIENNVPVWDLFIQRFPRTLDLTIFSMIIAAFIGTKAGVISAKHRNKPPDTIVRGFALVGVAVPIFFLGMILQYILAYQLPILPATGYKTKAYEDPDFITGFLIIDSLMTGKWYFTGDYIIHLILPVFCLSFVTLASITRQTRSSMLEVLEQDYVRTARAKGCKEKNVIHSHALRNALLPTITIIGLNIASLLGGAIITEATFGLVGIGSLFIDAIVLRDYWVLSALVFITTLILILTTLITDVLYAMLDPRIRYA